MKSKSRSALLLLLVIVMCVLSFCIFNIFLDRDQNESVPSEEEGLPEMTMEIYEDEMAVPSESEADTGITLEEETEEQLPKETYDSKEASEEHNQSGENEIRVDKREDTELPDMP